MKIKPDSLNSGITQIQRGNDSQATPQNLERTSEAPAETKSLQSAKQLASNVKAEESMISQMRAADLQNLLLATNGAKLEKEVKQLWEVSAIPVPNPLQPLLDQLETLKAKKAEISKQIVEVHAEALAAMQNKDERGMQIASAKLEALQSELATVDHEIKSILQQIDNLQKKEDRTADEVKSSDQAVNTPIRPGPELFRYASSIWKKDDDE